ncbi:site-specific DNA-methyltransferase, partial [Candidatus Kaiserbacteria bacterium]|nr:site-specific DNA-methyltransferase [Candidatus Kaiserbacteria bacterium]
MSTKRERDLAMADKQDSLGQLQTFLNKLFQFESQDLDFGVYKILHYKRAEIKEYIDTLLVDTVREQLSTLSESESEHIEEQLAELAEDGLVSAWIASKDKKQKEAFIASDSAGRIKQYQKLTKQKRSVTVSKEVENQIYNHLTTFFSRYYDKGDFISKRRFGKNEK